MCPSPPLCLQRYVKHGGVQCGVFTIDVDFAPKQNELNMTMAMKGTLILSIDGMDLHALTMEGPMTLSAKGVKNGQTMEMTGGGTASFNNTIEYQRAKYAPFADYQPGTKNSPPPSVAPESLPTAPINRSSFPSASKSAPPETSAEVIPVLYTPNHRARILRTQRCAPRGIIIVPEYPTTIRTRCVIRVCADDNSSSPSPSRSVRIPPHSRSLHRHLRIDGPASLMSYAPLKNPPSNHNHASPLASL